jgi:hypothetical protein
MKKAINYAVLGGSALTTIGGAMSTFNSFKDKKWMGVALGALTIGISIAAFKYSLAEIKAGNSEAAPAINTTPADKGAAKK